ncbi:prepilin-type N-terminal cleavage/methylation domain-containing protein [Rubellicoccus peritrichatus]|uniref:Prepilin-type N-terminal cleavage/methylation domain-containing protein n=1 Tax=Rubellicoccus peritrichatus TaxID=3080537 RepID=A0AAQ3QRP3_9BACT|nr:prepilin-type N-terminal cleavage/methylation domain-containing protein [Puniceicoccus sp. CR14]WOO39496.1 prepilin-type N-terminal cleavage/methylation domain-containing protein [Puniceicoccus sp. CR14]
MLKSTTRKLPVARQGLTLVELLVVLSILAVLSTVALRSVAQITEEKRYDANIAQLENIEEAVLGDRETVGFIGDIGRLPIAQGSIAEEQLSELWDGGSLPGYSIQTPAGDSEVRLGVGWRGPYLNLGINRDELTDGFGDALVHYEANGDPVSNGESVAILQSLGVDGASGGTGVNADTAIVLEATTGAVTNGLSNVEVNISEDIAVVVQNDSGNILQSDGQYILVRVYGANYAANGSGGLETLVQAKFDFTDSTDNPGSATEVASLSFTLSGLPYGPKIFRAYQVDDTTLPANNDDLTEQPAVAPTADRASIATHKNLRGRTDAITLTLLTR